MNRQIILWLSATALIGAISCAQLEDYELFPALTQGSWQVVSVDFADQREADSCDLQQVLRFDTNGDFLRDPGTCTGIDGLQLTSGNWRYSDRQEAIIVNEQFRSLNGGGRGVFTRRYDAAIVQDTLWLEALWEEGNDLYRLERR